MLAIAQHSPAEDGARLFVQAEVSDWTGSCSVRLVEKAALSIAGLSSKEEFLEQHRKGLLTLRRVHLRLKRNIVQEGKQVSLVGVCACPAQVSNPVIYMGPLLESSILPARLAELKSIPFGGLAVEVQGDIVPVRMAAVLLRCGEPGEREHRAETVECYYKEAQDASVGAGDATVRVCFVLPKSREQHLTWGPDDDVLVLIASAEFNGDGSLAEVLCADMRPAPHEAEEGGSTAQAFTDELTAVHSLLAKARSAGQKRAFSSTSPQLEEHFTPDKRRVCTDLRSPPTSEKAS